MGGDRKSEGGSAMGKADGYLKELKKPKKGKQGLQDKLFELVGSAKIGDATVAEGEPGPASSGGQQTAVYVIAVETDIGKDSAAF